MKCLNKITFNETNESYNIAVINHFQKKKLTFSWIF